MPASRHIYPVCNPYFWDWPLSRQCAEGVSRWAARDARGRDHIGESQEAATLRAEAYDHIDQIEAAQRANSPR